MVSQNEVTRVLKMLDIFRTTSEYAIKHYPLRFSLVVQYISSILKHKLFHSVKPPSEKL